MNNFAGNHIENLTINNFPYASLANGGPYAREMPAITAERLGAVIIGITRILDATCRARVCSCEAWSFNGLRVCSEGDETAEAGWHRWRLPSIDGLIRIRDANAPSVVLSPTGLVFWMDSDQSKPERVKLDELTLRCEQLAEAVRP